MKEYDDEILLGTKLYNQQEITNLLVSSLNMFQDYKIILNINYDEIMHNVNKAKEKEKKSFTQKFKDLSQEARNVKYLIKNLQLDEFNLGNQKGLITYVKDFKDTGESSVFMDMYDNTYLQNEISNSENQDDNHIYTQLEESENNDMSHLAEDDDFGENDGDEGF